MRFQTPEAANLDQWRDDFEGFAAKLDIIDLEGSRVRLRPNAIQAAFEVTRSGRDIILKPRQVGFTTWELARDIWFFLTRPGAQVVIVAQSDAEDDALKGISKKLTLMFDALAREMGLAFPVKAQGAMQWVFGNATLRIIGAGASKAAAEKKGRGGTIHRLHVTELAFFEQGEATLNALLECVPAPQFGSEITIESTANGAAGVFFERYKAAKSGRAGWSAHFFRWMDHAIYATSLVENDNIEPEGERERELLAKHGATLEQLKWYRAKVEDKGQALVDQEYPLDEDTCWLLAGRLFFDAERTRALYGLTKPPIETRIVGDPGTGGTLRIWERPVPGRRYVIVGDTSEGVGGDPSGGCVFDRSTGEHLATVQGQFKTWEFARVLAELGKEFSMAKLVVERNNHGHAVLQALDREQKYPRSLVHRAKDDRPGWVTGQISRAAALEALHAAHRHKKWSSPDSETIAQMLVFIVDDKGKPRAANGAHDELMIVHAIARDILGTANPMLAALAGATAKAS